MSITSVVNQKDMIFESIIKDNCRLRNSLEKQFSENGDLKRKLDIAKKALEAIDIECIGDDSRAPHIAWNALEEIGE